MSTSHRGTVVATAAFGLLAVLSPAAPVAHADLPKIPMSSHITIEQVGTERTEEGGYPKYQKITVEGVVSVSKAAAQDAINHGYHIVLRYWGDDTNSDDLMAGPKYPKTLYAADDGLHFSDDVTFNHTVLDEDSGTLENIGDGGMDELYVGARLLDNHNTEVGLVESNRIVQNL
jgi:hypothetical protein